MLSNCSGDAETVITIISFLVFSFTSFFILSINSSLFAFPIWSDFVKATITLYPSSTNCLIISISKSCILYPPACMQ